LINYYVCDLIKCLILPTIVTYHSRSPLPSYHSAIPLPSAHKHTIIHNRITKPLPRFSCFFYINKTKGYFFSFIKKCTTWLSHTHSSGLFKNDKLFTKTHQKYKILFAFLNRKVIARKFLKLLAII